MEIEAGGGLVKNEKMNTFSFTEEVLGICRKAKLKRMKPKTGYFAGN